MIGLSSLFKALGASAVVLLLTVGLAVWGFLQDNPAVGGLAAAAAVLAAMTLRWLLRANGSIRKAIATLGEAADGRLRSRILGIRGHGNIGEMLRDINLLLDQVEAFTKELDAAMKAAAEGRFYRKIQQRGLRGEFRRYAASVNATLTHMEDNVQRLGAFEGRMLKDAVTITMTVNEGAIANARIVTGIQSAVHEAQGMAAATEEMVAGIQEISSSSNETADMSTKAQSLTDDARQVVESAIAEFTAIEGAVAEAAHKVDALVKASEAIGEIVSSIESIASQTNLLALNATIEAARAGDAGKGFAVVANEVKNLSNQTARATEDISRRVEELRQEMAGIVTTMTTGTEAIAKGRGAMASMGERMGEVSDMVSNTTTRMSDISHILSQQAAAANEVSAGVQKMASEAKENAKAIELSSNALSGVEDEMSSLLAALADREIPNKIVMLAKSDHIVWRKRLVDMMIGKIKLAPDQMTDERGCRLGQWYYGPGSLGFRESAAYRELEAPHRAVHQHGIAVVRAFNSGQSTEGRRLFTLVEEASQGVIACLDRLMAEKPALPSVGSGGF